MVYICCVPQCRGNYKNGPKVSIYKFPTEETLKRSWLLAIKRDNFMPTKYSRVCERHFREEDFQFNNEAYNPATGDYIQVPLEHKRLKSGAVPSIMPDAPAYLSTTTFATREAPEDRRQRIEMKSLKEALEKSMAEFKNQEIENIVESFDDLLQKFQNFQSEDYFKILKKNELLFLSLDTSKAPKVSHSLIISSKLEAHAYVGDRKIEKVGKFIFPLIVNSSSTVLEVLDSLKNVKCQLKNKNGVKETTQLICDLLKTLVGNSAVTTIGIEFLIEQVTFIGNSKHARRYSSDIMIFSSLLYTIAPSAYRFLRQSGYLALPHPNTINNLCSKYNVSPQLEQLDTYFLLYIKQKFKYLSDKDKIVSLLLDEVHLKEYFDFKGGKVSGMSHDFETSASSAQVFMIKSISSPYKDVVHVLPIHSISGSVLHEFIKKVVIGLEQIGFTVISIITDNISVNRKAVELFLDPPELSYCYPHPVDKSRPLFFIVDPVHEFKCIRNNWINQKNDGRCFFYPKFDSVNPIEIKTDIKTARFSTIKDLYSLECDKLIKYGFKLNLKALAPSSLERQNVKLVLCIFNEHVVEALNELGGKHNLINFQDTSDFLKIIITWWQIMNVKTPNKGNRLNNRYQDPFCYDENDIKVVFLEKFLKWIDIWESLKFSTGTFTRETRTALVLTTKAIIEISGYCKDTFNMKYILPGKFQTDDLESRFGSYRRLAGCQYNISTQQLFECEKKLRIQSLLRLSIPSESFDVVEISNLETGSSSSDYDPSSTNIFPGITVEPIDITNSEENLPVLMYLAGYCIFSVLKKTNCTSCRQIHQLDKEVQLTADHSFIKNLDRGKLSFPQKHILNAVLFNFIVISKICEKNESEFLKLQHQRRVVTCTTYSILEEREFCDSNSICDKGHLFNSIIWKVLWCSTNIFLNNYVKKKNDTLNVQKNLAAKKAEKRKQKSVISSAKKSKGD